MCSEATTLPALVERYLQRRQTTEWENDRIEPAFDLAGAISNAALARTRKGVMHSHLRNVGKNVLRRVEAALLSDIGAIDSASTFEDLHHIVIDKCREIHRAGKLTAYDIAYWIGVHKGIEPELVYLHAGAEEGASYMVEGGAINPILRGSKKTYEVVDFPAPLNSLRADEIENFLCIYRKELKFIYGNKGSL